MDAQFVPVAERVNTGVIGRSPRLPTTISGTEQVVSPLKHFVLGEDDVVIPIDPETGPRLT
jgi:hypothetical protein